MRRFVAVAVWLLVLCASAYAGPEPAQVSGRITDPQTLPLPGVSISLLSSAGTTVATTITDEDGIFTIDAPPGAYQIHAELSGFEPLTQSNVDASRPATLTLTLRLATLHEQVTVAPEPVSPVIGVTAPNAPVSVTRSVIDNGMLPNSQYDDVLPLLPNVVRGPDGQISVGGSRAPEGALVVNGVNATDPVIGAPGLMLPIEAVDSVEVFAGGYPADLGLATGGITSVHTRSGADTFHMTASSFFPRLRFINGKVSGIDSWEPNIGASGPIDRDRIYFEEALSYRFDRNRYATLVGPQDNVFDALQSWSQFDVRLGASQDVSFTGGFDMQRTDHWNITAFTPASTVPELLRKEWATSLADRFTTTAGSTLEIHGALLHTGTNVDGSATGRYRLGHDMTTGSYFNSQDLQGSRLEAGASWTWAPLRSHLVKFGATVARAGLDGVDRSMPVDLLRSDGTVARTIRFRTGGAMTASQIETGAFAQDTWSVSSALTLDAGVRYDASSQARTSRIAPRAAFTFKLPDTRTTISGSVGAFTNRLVLEALAYPQLPARVELLDPDGTGDTLVFSRSSASPLDLPRAMRWDLELDRRFDNGMTVRVKYQERHGTDELVVAPTQVTATRGALVLSSTGTSDARSLETTVGYRSHDSGQEIFASYVRARAVGNYNSFDAIEGLFRDPFVQGDAVGPLRADVPNRLLAWGMIHVPKRFTVAPFVEVRDGFPYSAITDAWTFAGPRNGYRMPWFGSLDLYVNKIVGLPMGLPDARVGLKLYNIAAVHSERDVQRDISRPDFGTTYNANPRDFVIVFELLWGKH